MNNLKDRSYRARKDQYTKALETELQKVQISEEKLSKENARLRQNIQNLTGLLSQSRGDASEHLYVNNDHAGENSSPQSGLLYGFHGDGDVDVAAAHRQPNPYPYSQPDKPAALVSHHSNHHRLCDLDLTVAGMDFVLTYVFHFTKKQDSYMGRGALEQA